MKHFAPVFTGNYNYNMILNYCLHFFPSNPISNWQVSSVAKPLDHFKNYSFKKCKKST